MTVLSIADAKKNLNFLTSPFYQKKDGSKTTAQLLSEAFNALNKQK